MSGDIEMKIPYAVRPTVRVAELEAELAQLQARNRELEKANKKFVEALAVASHEGWQTAHDSRECGHPLAFYRDENWPESEASYNPETGISTPPMQYSCGICSMEKDRSEMQRLLEGAMNALKAITRQGMEAQPSSVLQLASRVMQSIDAALAHKPSQDEENSHGE